MKRFLVYCQKETVIAGTLIALILFLSILPDIIKCTQTPTGHVYNPIHNNAIDYAVYVNFVKQGLDGQSTLYNRFTSELHQGGLVVPFYLILGRLWRLTGVIDPHIVYHSTRIILGIMWALLLYWYIRRTLPTKTGRLIALFLALYSTSFPIWRYPENLLSVTTYMAWWTELNPMVRATFIPAHLTGHILMLIMIAMFTGKKLTSWNMIIGTAAGFFAGLFHTPSLMLPCVLLPLWATMTGQWKRLLICIICFPVSALSFLILSRQFSILPWTLIWKYESQSFAISLSEYLLGLGPIVPLGILGFFIAWKQRQGIVWILWTTLCIIAVGWITMITQLPIPFIRSFPISNVRFLQMALVVPLSLLSSITLLFIKNHFEKWIFSLLCISIIFLTFVSYPASITTQSLYMFNGPSYQYPTRTWMKAVKSLENGNKDTVVISLPFAGLGIGMNTNRTVFIGRDVYTINFFEKTDRAWKVYAGSMPLCDTFEFLSQNRIGEVFSGYDEQTAGGDLTRYPFLKLKKDFGDTQIFEFNGKKPSTCP